MATDREMEAWERLGRVAAISLVESLAELVNDAPPGGIWGRECDVHVEVLPKAEAACRAHTERILFQHPSFALTGGSCRWDEQPQAPLVPGYVALRVVVRWPRFEDSPLMKGTTGPKPLGLSFSPEMAPTIEVPRSIEQDGWKPAPCEFPGCRLVRGHEGVHRGRPYVVDGGGAP